MDLEADIARGHERLSDDDGSREVDVKGVVGLRANGEGGAWGRTSSRIVSDGGLDKLTYMVRINFIYPRLCRPLVIIPAPR